jgi:GGDEF domain-containing protein
MLARIGADLFAVIARGVRNAADVVRVLEEHVFACFQQPFTLNGEDVIASARAGIALYPPDGTDADTLFSNVTPKLR